MFGAVEDLDVQGVDEGFEQSGGGVVKLGPGGGESRCLVTLTWAPVPSGRVMVMTMSLSSGAAPLAGADPAVVSNRSGGLSRTSLQYSRYRSEIPCRPIPSGTGCG